MIKSPLTQEIYAHMNQHKTKVLEQFPIKNKNTSMVVSWSKGTNCIDKSSAKAALFNAL